MTFKTTSHNEHLPDDGWTETLVLSVDHREHWATEHAAACRKDKLLQAMACPFEVSLEHWSSFRALCRFHLLGDTRNQETPKAQNILLLLAAGGRSLRALQPTMTFVREDGTHALQAQPDQPEEEEDE